MAGRKQKLRETDSVEESDVSRRNVQQIDPKFFERVQSPSDIGPAGAELLLQLRLPIGPYIRWKFGAYIEVCTGEIQNEWALDDSKFEHAQVIVATEQLRH